MNYDSVRAFCLFAGYPRSGHSLVGALLDAHPDVVVSNELNALRKMEEFGGVGLLDAIVRLAGKQSAKRFGYPNYSYAVPGQWQGRVRSPVVLGDNKGGKTSLMLRDNPGLLARLQRIVRLPVKVVHVVRNPYDMVATAHARGLSLPAAVSKIARCLRGTIIARDEADAFFTLGHESLLTDPAVELRRLAIFLGVDMDESWVRACSAILYASPHESRREIEWTTSAVSQVDAMVRDSDGLFGGYSF